METATKVQRSELWNKIYEKVKQLPRAKVDGDAVDHPSLTTTLEELFLEEKKIGNTIKGSYYIEAKIVTGGVLQSNDNHKLIEEFKSHGFQFKGEPIIQSNNEVCWSFVEKNNNLITEENGRK